MYNYKNNLKQYSEKNKTRVFRLYLKYWIIIAIFVLMLGSILKKPGFPRSLDTLLLTLSGINPGYNGAWWFFTTYIILVLFSKSINSFILKNNNKIIIFLSLAFYLIGYIQRIKVPIILNNIYGDYILRQLALLGTSQLPFVVGSIFQKEKFYSKLQEILEKYRYKNYMLSLIILILFVFHMFVETLFVGAFIGIIFIPVFNSINKKVYLNTLFEYMGKHSTNLWLVHMFFYMIFFKKLVYYPRYPIFIFVWLILLCLPFSYLIDYIENKILIIKKADVNYNYRVK